MKQTGFILLGLLFTLKFNVSAQEEEKKFGISFSGFVKNDFFFDSRQTEAPREGHFLLWPLAEVLDADGADINARNNFNFLAIQSRLTGVITGPDAFGAKVNGMAEIDFLDHNSIFDSIKLDLSVIKPLCKFRKKSQICVFY